MLLECSTNFRGVQTLCGLGNVFASLTYSNLNSTRFSGVCYAHIRQAKLPSHRLV